MTAVGRRERVVRLAGDRFIDKGGDEDGKGIAEYGLQPTEFESFRYKLKGLCRGPPTTSPPPSHVNPGLSSVYCPSGPLQAPHLGRLRRALLCSHPGLHDHSLLGTRQIISYLDDPVLDPKIRQARLDKIQSKFLQFLEEECDLETLTYTLTTSGNPTPYTLVSFCANKIPIYPEGWFEYDEVCPERPDVLKKILDIGLLLGKVDAGGNPKEPIWLIPDQALTLSALSTRVEKSKQPST